MDIVDKGVVLKKKQVNKKTEKPENKGRNKEAKLNKKENDPKGRLFKRIIKIAVVLLIVFLSVFTFISTRGGSKASIFQQFDQLVNKEKPFAIVIYDTYSPLGKSKLDNINKVTDKLKEKIPVLIIEYKEDDEKSHFFIDKYDVETLPAIILLNSKGEKVVRFFWPFSTLEILRKAEEVLVKEGK